MRSRSIPSLALALPILLVLAAPPAVLSQPLSPIYETTIGGYDLPSGRGAAVDDAGNVYVIGRWIGGTQQNNILIAKVAPTGEVVWTRAIAGQDHDYATDIALDPHGDPVVVGWTDSADFPLVAALDRPTDFRDAFVMRCSADDGSILLSTRLGGDYSDMATGLAIGPDGAIHVAGWTESSDFPTVDAIQDHLNGPDFQLADAFVTRLSPDGQTILYSTYLGGRHHDMPAGLALGPGGEMIIAGTTQSTDYPLQQAIQTENHGGHDGFVTSIAPGGEALVFSTYLGGEDVDRLLQVVADADGSVVVTGATRSLGYPATPGAYLEEFVGEVNGCEIPFGGHYNCEDGFLTRLAPDGSLVFSTFLGGSAVDVLDDVALDASGRAHVIGSSVSSDFPPAGIDGDASIVVRRFTADGSDVDGAFTTFSGTANSGHGIAIGADGDVYVTGSIGHPAEVYVARLATNTTTDAPVRDRVRVQMLPARPNPFNPATEVVFRLPSAMRARLTIHDARGRLQAVLRDEAMAAGDHRVRWSPRGVASGIYFARLRAGGATRSERLVLLK